MILIYSHEELVAMLQGMNLTEIGRQTGLHLNTLCKFRAGEHVKPSYETIIILNNYFKDRMKGIHTVNTQATIEGE